MSAIDYTNSLKINSQEFCELIRESLIRKNIVPPKNSKLRKMFEYKFEISRENGGYSLELTKIKLPEAEKEYTAGSWMED